MSLNLTFLIYFNQKYNDLHITLAGKWQVESPNCLFWPTCTLPGSRQIVGPCLPYNFYLFLYVINIIISENFQKKKYIYFPKNGCYTRFVIQPPPSLRYHVQMILLPVCT